MSGIGHNRGPSMAAGAGFRRLAWQKARADLLPTLPLEIVRLRVARAKRLGLPYKTYATIRAVSGTDIVGFLFSDNALGMDRAGRMPGTVAARLAALPAVRLAAVHAPLSPEAVLGHAIDAATRAPELNLPWRAARQRLRDLVRDGAARPDGVVVVAATALERDWCASAGLAGCVGAETLFGGSARS